MHPSPRILIVDDEAYDALTSLLRWGLPKRYGSEDCEVIHALGGRMAQRILREDGPFDLVLTDGYMPNDLDGIELILSIRSGETEAEPSGTPRDVIIILFTAWRDEEFKHRMMEARADMTLGKPLPPDMLIDYLVIALNERDARASSGQSGSG